MTDEEPTYTGRDRQREEPSGTLPQDPFEQQLARLVGLPNGAHTKPTIVSEIDWYGNTTQYIIQTVKADEGESVFLTIVAADAQRFVLPPRVLTTIDRQRTSTQKQVKRRHGRRLYEERKMAGTKLPSFTAKSRAKGLASRRRKAAIRQARRAKTAA